MEEDSQVRTPDHSKRTPELNFSFSYSSQENPELLEQDSDLVEDVANLLVRLGKDGQEANVLKSSTESGEGQSSRPSSAPVGVPEKYGSDEGHNNESHSESDSEKEIRQSLLKKVFIF